MWGLPTEWGSGWYTDSLWNEPTWMLSVLLQYVLCVLSFTHENLNAIYAFPLKVMLFNMSTSNSRGHI